MFSALTSLLASIIQLISLPLFNPLEARGKANTCWAGWLENGYTCMLVHRTTYKKNIKLRSKKEKQDGGEKIEKLYLNFVREFCMSEEAWRMLSRYGSSYDVIGYFLLEYIFFMLSKMLNEALQVFVEYLPSWDSISSCLSTVEQESSVNYGWLLISYATHSMYAWAKNRWHVKYLRGFGNHAMKWCCMYACTRRRCFLGY